MNQRMLTSVVPKQKGINDALVSALIGNVTSCIEILNSGITERELIRSKSQAVCTMLQEHREYLVQEMPLQKLGCIKSKNPERALSTSFAVSETYSPIFILTIVMLNGSLSK